MEYVQIIFNIVILGGLVWFVFRETLCEYATKRDISIVSLEVDELYDTLKRAISEMEEREGEEPSATVSIANIDVIEMIRLGSELTANAYQAGAKIVVDALVKDGRLTPDPQPKPLGAVNLDEFAVDESIAGKREEDEGLPPIIAKMNERMGREFAIAGLKGGRQ